MQVADLVRFHRIFLRGTLAQIYGEILERIFDGTSEKIFERFSSGIPEGMFG